MAYNVGATEVISNLRELLNIANQENFIHFGTILGTSSRVGKYALLRAVTGGPYNIGDTITGGNVSATDVNGNPTLTAGAAPIIVLTGTWQCQGKTTTAGTTSTAAQPNMATLWLRIA